MQRVRTGDKNAYRQILDQQLPSVSSYVTRMTGTSGEAEDITQEVFLRLWTHAERYDPLDEAKLDNAITDLRATSAKFQAAMHDQAMFLIRHMDVEERKKVARYLHHRRPGDKHRARQ